jgi:hypothetical protein
MSESVLTQIQDDIADRLAADDYFSDIPVMSERKADLLNEITKSLGTITKKGGKCGVCVVVLSPEANNTASGVPGGILGVTIPVRVLEDPLYNNDATTGTQKAALTIARRIALVLDSYSPEGVCQCLRLDKSNTIEPTQDVVAPIAYDVNISTVEGYKIPYTKVNTPTISPRSGTLPQTITLACATALASIYYTTDGSYPSSINTHATLYATPFTLSTACTLRVVAYLAGSIASDSSSQSYT